MTWLGRAFQACHMCAIIDPLHAVIPVHDTPFVTSSSVIPDKNGAEQLIVIFKASFDVSEGGALTPAEEQDPIVTFDELRGEPVISSILRDGEMMPIKPEGTDVPDDRPTPIAFGPIGRHWEPRIQYAGTYEQTWVEDVAPLLPDDFDERFHHATPPDQVLAGHVQGGDLVEIRGCTSCGSLTLVLPTLRPRAYVRVFLEEFQEHPLSCDSVIIDTDRLKMCLVYKVAMPMADQLLDLPILHISLGEEAAA